MGASLSFSSLLFTVLLVLARFVASSHSQCDYPLQQNEDPACTSCFFRGNNVLWMWVAEHDTPFVPWLSSVTLTSTQTLVYVVDPTLGVTTTTTVMPADYISSNFNQEGTRIATVIWTRGQSQATTSVVTFPTGVMQWAGGLAWRGNMTVSGTQVIQASGSLVTITSNPQPEFTGVLGPRNASGDTRGSSYQIYRIPETLGLFFNGNEHLFPDQAVIQSCAAEIDGGPLNGAFTEVQWATSTTTSFVDLGALSGTALAEPGRTMGTVGPKQTGDPTTSEATGPSQTKDSAGSKLKGHANMLIVVGSWAAFFTRYW